MQIRFADARPSGAYALAIPVRGEDMLHDRLGRAGRAGAQPRRPRGRGAALRARGRRDRRDLRRATARRRAGCCSSASAPSSDDDARPRARRRRADRQAADLGRDQAGDRSQRPRPRRRRGGPARASARGAQLAPRRLSHQARPTSRSRRSRRSSIVGAGDGAEAAWQRTSRRCSTALELTRELVTEPANIVYPESFVERCREALEGIGVEFEVLDETAMAQARHGRAARRRPGLGPRRRGCWRCAGTAARRATAPVAFVGKGVTFDTGGISIKPAAGMEEMKWDMGGAGAVAGAMQALATRKAKANVVGICGARREHARRQRPAAGRRRHLDVGPDDRGDQHRRRRAAGAVDAMTWAQRQYKPEVMVDLATLTGAMIIASATNMPACSPTTTASPSSSVAAGEASGDKLWRHADGRGLRQDDRQPIADMKNSRPARGRLDHRRLFLERFVEEGVEMGASRHRRHGLGGQGRANSGTRARPASACALLDRYVADNHEGWGAPGIDSSSSALHSSLESGGGCHEDFVAGLCLSLMLLPAPALAQDPGMNEIIVTGSRINRDEDGGGRPAVGLRRTADFAVMYVSIAGDTREIDRAGKRYCTMVRSAIELARRSGIELATGDFIVAPLTARQLPYPGDGQRWSAGHGPRHLPRQDPAQCRCRRQCGDRAASSNSCAPCLRRAAPRSGRRGS